MTSSPRRLGLSTLLASALDLALIGGAMPAAAKISDGIVKVGVLTDLFGFYTDIIGKGTIKLT